MALLSRDMYPALNEDMIARLRNMNVYNVYDFANEDTERLRRIAEMSYQDVKKFKAQIVENYGGIIRSGCELSIVEEPNVIVSTGIENLDSLLNGGLQHGEIYELCGLSSAGKTQICLNLAVNIILRTNGSARYIDTKSDCSASRIHMILEAKGHDDEDTARVMNRLGITRVTDIDELLAVLYDLAASLKAKSEREEKDSTRLVIIDSLPAIISAWSDDCESFYALNHVANVCRFIANEYRVNIVTVNLVTEWRDAEGFGASLIERPPAVVKPNLGKFWLQVPSTRLLVENPDNEKRKITIWKSTNLRVGDSCIVTFSDTGVN